jgi:choline-sulfatase
MRRWSWLALGLGAWTLAGCDRGPKQPNVLLIVLDTSRWDHFQTYGYERATSPNLLALSERGAVFEQAHGHTGWTGPSMGSLMTSLTPRDHGLVQWEFPLEAEHLTLAEVLQSHGYQTFAVVSHFVFEPKLGFDQGFESYDRSVLDKGSPHRTHTSEEVTNKALKALHERDTSRPWLMWAHYFDPHAEYLAHQAYDFGQSPMGLYDSELAYSDEHIGRLLDALQERGELENTWIVVTADHGEEFRDHGGKQHRGQLYEELVHVPLTIVGPGVQPQRVPAVVRNSDIAPTLLGLAGLPIPPAFLGEPMALVDGRFVVQDRPVYLEVLRHGDKRGLLDGHFKVIRDLDKGTVELFDLEADPRERTNLASRYETLTAELLARVDAYYAQPHFAPSVQELSEADTLKLELLGYMEPEEASEEAAAP